MIFLPFNKNLNLIYCELHYELFPYEIFVAICIFIFY